MSDAITLTLRQSVPGRLLADVIAPDRLAALSNAEIGALPVHLSRAVQTGDHRPRRTFALGELFTIQGERATTVRVLGDLHAADSLGANMGRGALVIDGDVGCELGRMMQGGTISVSGSAGTDAGLAMAGGTIMIAGDAGDRLAGPLPGASRGMTGGEILVRGHAGRDAACAVRRGLVVIGGDARDAGRAMIAGTLVVIGAIAGSPGEWNKRGSIVTIGGASVPPTYRYACTYRPPYLALLHHYLRSRGWPIDERIATGRFARYCGDVSQLARGELLAWADKASA